MLKWSKSDLKSKKAQFFIISTVIVAIFLASISGLLRDYSAIDLSQIPEQKEGNLFVNAKENIKNTIDSCSCPGDKCPRNLKELERFLEEEAIKMGIGLNITNTTSVCPKPVNVSMKLRSSNIIIKDAFQYP